MFTSDYYDPSTSGDVFAFVVLLGLFAFVAIFGLIMYVVTALMLHPILKRAGHKHAYAAWIPIWNNVALLQMGGIKQAWPWVLIFYFGSAVLSWIPFVGTLVTLVLLVLAIIVYYYAFKNLQTAFGIGGTATAVLGVIFTFFYLIWLVFATKGKDFNLAGLVDDSNKMPLNWFGDEDITKYFNHTLVAGGIPNMPTVATGAPVSTAIATGATGATLNNLMAPPPTPQVEVTEVPQAPVWPEAPKAAEIPTYEFPPPVFDKPETVDEAPEGSETSESSDKPEETK